MNRTHNPDKSHNMHDAHDMHASTNTSPNTSPNTYVLVTGAGSGLGKEFVRIFLDAGRSVIAVSLLPGELSRLADEHRQGDTPNPRLITYAQDLSTLDAAEVLLDWLKTQEYTVDTLINNAGFACFGDVVDTDAVRIANMLHLNVVTMTKLATLLGAQMKERRHGQILNVGSSAGFVPIVRFAAYGASKAYVNHFSYALRTELAPFGVSVTCLMPGAINTNFAKTAHINTFDRFSMLKAWFETGKVQNPAQVAQAAYAGLQKNQAEVIIGIDAWMSWLASRIFPTRFVPVMMKYF